MLLSDFTVSIDASGNATVTADQLDNGTTDNCAIATMSVSPNTFNCDQLGAQVVTVTVTDAAGNAATGIATVTINDANNNCPLATSQFHKSSFTVYPNPSADLFFVETANKEVLHSITVYTVTGQAVLKASFGQPLSKYEISTAHLSEGIYMMKLESASGTSVKRIAKKNN